jgi:hypothetical protein
VRVVRVDPAWLDGYPALDVLGAFVGPCWVCGGPDKRHRLADALVENVRAGDSVEFVAAGYDVPVETVRRLVEVWVP